MKVSDLFERHYSDGYPVSVEYELEYTTPDGDVDYKMVEVSGEVLVTPDAYGTGDSPTDYEFNVEEVVDTETGSKIDPKAIPEDGWKWIENQAIEKVQRHM